MKNIFIVLPIVAALTACGTTDVYQKRADNERERSERYVEKAIDKATVKSLKNAGFKVQSNATFSPKPRYLVSYSWNSNPMLMFSKKSDNFQIPTSNVVTFAVDENLEINSDEMCKKVAGEMFFVAEKIQSSNMLSLQP